MPIVALAALAVVAFLFLRNGTGTGATGTAPSGNLLVIRRVQLAHCQVRVYANGAVKFFSSGVGGVEFEITQPSATILQEWAAYQANHPDWNKRDTTYAYPPPQPAVVHTGTPFSARPPSESPTAVVPSRGTPGVS